MKNKILDSKNIKIIIPIIVLLVLGIIVFIYLKEYQYNQYRDKKDTSLYYYFAGNKSEYEATISYNKKEEIKAVVAVDRTINYDSVPIYFKDEKKVIFPSEMNIIFPIKNDLQKKTKEFSYIEKVNNLYYMTFEDYKSNIDHFVMYDGNYLYFFSDSVTLTINNETVTLSPMSYVVAKKNEFGYYNYEMDEYKSYETSKEITVTNEYYTINVTNDYIEYPDNRLLLTKNFGFLSVLEKDSK